MAEKIVQLIDKDNNNLYPVAGSLKQGSVTTSTIDDGAVTADKINFSSLGFVCKACPRLDFKTSSTSFGSVFPSGWDLTFSTVTHGVYEITAQTEFTANIPWEDTSELDYALEIVSGGTILVNAGSTMTNTHGAPRILTLVARATSDSMSVRLRASSIRTNSTVALYKGVIMAKRVA